MKSSDRFKICSHCEGRIPVEVVICPYCASTVSGQDGFTKPNASSKNSTETLASLYNPPYASQRSAPTSLMEEKKVVQPAKSDVKSTTMDKNNAASEKSEILPISLLVVGSNLLVIGLMQLFLSDDGILSLEWKSQFWYLYSLIAAPMIWFGVKSLKSNS